MTPRVTRRAVLASCATVGVAAAGCLGDDGDGGDGDDGDDDPLAGDAEGSGDLALATSAFEDGESIPEQYARDGENVNPPLGISGVPTDVGSLAIVVDDPDAPNGTFDHWLVWNVSTDVDSVPEGWDPPEGVVQGENDFGNARYDGPDPPGGETHEYRFKLYALDTELDVSAGADRDDLGEAVQGQVAAQTQLTGTYGS